MDGQRKVVFFDLETSGLNPKRHPIIQIAAIACDDECEPIEAFEAKIRFDERKAKRHSLRKNHYHPGVWAREARDESDIAHSFADYLKRHATFPMTSARGDQYYVGQLVAHNAVFDGPYIQTWYERLGIFLPAKRQVLCTMQRAIWYFVENPTLLPPKDFKLATLCQYFGIPVHAAAAHEALADVTATVMLYRAMLGSNSVARRAAAA
jgi:DNA polymerase III epsilon subunit-like protein